MERQGQSLNSMSHAAHKSETLGDSDIHAVMKENIAENKCTNNFCYLCLFSFVLLLSKMVSLCSTF